MLAMAGTSLEPGSFKRRLTKVRKNKFLPSIPLFNSKKQKLEKKYIKKSRILEGIGTEVILSVS
jgi:hypothetical protein